MNVRATCSVAVAALRRRPLLGLAAGIGALAAIRPLSTRVGSAGIRSLQVTHSLNAAPLAAVGHLGPWLHRSQSTLAGLFSLSQPDPTMASLNPPQAAPKWSHSPEDVLALTKTAIEADRAVLDKVAALKPEECTFESVRAFLLRFTPSSMLTSLCSITSRPARR